MTIAPRPEPLQTGWPRWRSRLFHLYFLLRRPMTLGVRVAVLDEAQRRIFLIRHTYVPGWQLPGGGVETGETMYDAAARELDEEANISFLTPPRLVSVHFNRQASRRDHVAMFVATDFAQHGPKMPDHEIAEAGFFSLDALPEGTTSATRRRIAEIVDGAAASSFW